MNTPALRPSLPAPRLRELDEAIRTLLAGGSTDEVQIIGAGELTCVVEWDGLACKRLPPVTDPHRPERYGELLAEYLAALKRAGIPAVETGFQVATHQDVHVGYILQPRLPSHTLLPAVMAGLGVEQALVHFETILDHVDAAVAAGIGIDPQVSNWGIRDGAPLLLDVTTPMLRDEAGRDRLDTELFVAMLPRMVQGVVRRYMVQDLLNKNFRHREILLDLVGNVVNYGLEHFTEPFLEAANRRLAGGSGPPAPAEHPPKGSNSEPPGSPLSLREVERYRTEEKWTWWAMRRSFAAEQVWRKYVLRAPALHLLPSRFKGKASTGNR